MRIDFYPDIFNLSEGMVSALTSPFSRELSEQPHLCTISTKVALHKRYGFNLVTETNSVMSITVDPIYTNKLFMYQ